MKADNDMNADNEMKEMNEKEKRMSRYGRMEVWVWFVVTVWCGATAVRCVVQRADMVGVIGFGVGAWASWLLWRMAREEVREDEKE